MDLNRRSALGDLFELLLLPDVGQELVELVDGRADSAGEWQPVSPIDVTVLTDYRVDGANKKLQKKTRTITVIAAGTESGWIDVHTGADCP